MCVFACHRNIRTRAITTQWSIALVSRMLCSDAGAPLAGERRIIAVVRFYSRTRALLLRPLSLSSRVLYKYTYIYIHFLFI